MITIPRLLLPVFAVLACLACASKDGLVVEHPSGVEFRAVVEPGVEGAEEFPVRHRDGAGERDSLWLGPGRSFEIERAFASQDNLGRPAIGMDIGEGDVEAFREWTGALVEERMAIVVGGEVLAAPTVDAAIVRGLVIRGLFDEEDVTSILDAMTPGEER